MSMERFHYKAVSAGGGLTEGEVEALTENDALLQVKAMGHAPISAIPVNGVHALSLRLARRKGVHVGAFARDLGTLLESGVPLDRALAMVAELSSDKRQSEPLAAMLDAVRNGRSLSEAMAAAEGGFSRFHINMVRAGEASGALGKVLLRLADSIDQLDELKEGIRSALIYPALLLLITLLSLGLLMVVVVPQFTVLFEDMGADLPLATRIVSGAGDLLRDYWWAGLLLLLLLVKAVEMQWRQAERRIHWERRLMRLPLVGELMVKAQMAIFARTFSTLLGNGVPMLAALRIVGETLTNLVLQRAVTTATDAVKEGSPLARALKEQQWFPPLTLHLIRVGEETGRMEPMLLRLAEIYDREVKTTVQRLLTLLEPVLIIGLGVMVGGIIMSILVAILSINDLTL